MIEPNASVSPPWPGLIGAWIPLLLIGAMLAPFWCCESWRLGLPISLTLLYLMPPLLARVILLAGRPSGTFTLTSRQGLIWYALHLLQVIFLRFPALEEPLRMVPGLYQLWLNLWGSDVSLFSVWGPGAVVSDRHAVHVGRGALIGGRAFISSHTLGITANGGVELVCADVHIGAGATVGGLVMIGPGCVVEAHELIPASDRLPPFTTFSGGRRRKREGGSGAPAPTDPPASQGAEQQANACGDG